MHESRRAKWYRGISGWDDACLSNHASGIVTYRAVPFVLPLERTRDGDDAFVERSDSHRPLVWSLLAFVVVTAVPALFALMELYGAFVNDKQMHPIGILMLVWALVFWPFLTWIAVAVWYRRTTTARRLVFLLNGLELAIQTVRSSGEIESEVRAAAAKCELRVCPLDLSMRRGMMSFQGWIVHVVVADRRIALACVRTENEATLYVQQLPGWLRAIDAGRGEPVTGELLDRHFGNTPRVGGPSMS